MSKTTIVLFLCCIVAACGKPEDDSDLRAAFAQSALKDPSSVQFANVAENHLMICGEYNSKNGFGAYTGFDTFVFDRNSKTLWIADESSNPAPPSEYAQCPNASDLLRKDSARLEAEMKRTESE